MPSILFVCTGNTCRSPMAVGIARALLGSLDVSVSSAGVLGAGRTATPEAVAEMQRRGIDISAHRSRLIESALNEPIDLVLGLAGEHAREVVELRSDLFTKTFTLKEFVRRATEAGPRAPGESIEEYAKRLGAGREVWNLAGIRAADDIADPLGMGAAAYERCGDEVEAMVRKLVELVWP